MTRSRLLFVTVLLFASGFAALIFQVAWLREFRLVFGASTSASAAVLAIFMGGIGIGSAWLGRLADRHEDPLRLYGYLLLTMSIAALASPLLIDGIRWVYVALGGQSTLGGLGATVVRLLLSVLVLGVPTVVMGGTLPAATRAVTTSEDSGRRGLAILYGLNTLGAVAGAALSTFYLLEALGTRNALYLACLLNIFAGIAAILRAQIDAAAGAAGAGASPGAAPQELPAGTAAASPSGEDGPASSVPAAFVFTAAGVVGFAFFLMELVWYRMLGPLLGGSTYTFGLILVVALFGIGLGGAAYGLVVRHARATLIGFTLTCALEAVCMAYPYALGDRLAMLAAMLREMGAFGFFGDVLGWTAVACIVILPAAFISGIQFPLLISLLGSGQKNVGRHVGYAMAVNTLGAICGSLAGGFGLLPWLTAPGAWRAVVLLLSGLAAAGILLSCQRSARALRVFAPSLFLAAAVLLITATGPTAAWRHSPVGAGRVRLPDRTINAMRSWQNQMQRAIIWEAEGVETSVALSKVNGLAFILNGKVDGNAVHDAGTQVMLGLVGGILHPEPKACMVVGLGTGESAGWLAEIESMQTVDVAELEPQIDMVADLCQHINFNVLQHKKVNILYNDAREVLVTIPKQYDLIVSEPSNPYRAGIATLYTKEFYESVQARLNTNGMFLQWLQAYEIDSQTVRTVLATLRSVFPHVEVWQTKPSDMLLLCSLTPIQYDVPTLRKRIKEDPFRKALSLTWRVNDLEGVLAHYVAGPGLADLVSREEGLRISTDDRNRVEYGFARTVGRKKGFAIEELRAHARELAIARPAVQGGEVDWKRVADERVLLYTHRGDASPVPVLLDQEQQFRARAQALFLKNNLPGALAAWNRQPRGPSSPMELVMLGCVCVAMRDHRAEAVLKRLGEYQPLEAIALQGELAFLNQQPARAAALLEKFFLGLRNNPWPHGRIIRRALNASVRLAQVDPAAGERLFTILLTPFDLYVEEEARLAAAFKIGQQMPPVEALKVLAQYEPHVPWNEKFLGYRYQQYKAAGHRLERVAKRELLEFVRQEPMRFRSEQTEGIASDPLGVDTETVRPLP